MKILITGSEGFLGQHLKSALNKDHEVTGLDTKSGASLISDLTSLSDPLPDYDLVVHAAGKAHQTPRNDKEIGDFFHTNTYGTRNLLRALTTHPPSTFILISTVAVYGTEEGNAISEDHPLQGTTPYAKSKIQAEEAVISWAQQHHVSSVILRLPLVAGKNPPGNLGTMIDGIRNGYYLGIGDGQARRSMVLAEDVARAIPSLTGKSGIFHLTDGHHPSFRELEEALRIYLHKKKIRRIPFGAARFIAFAGDLIPRIPFNSSKLRQLTRTLTFSDTRARHELGWVSEKVADFYAASKSTKKIS